LGAAVFRTRATINKEEGAMGRTVRVLAGLSMGLLLAMGCGGGAGDSNLPVRRAKMREIKMSTDHMMASLQNRSVDGVEKEAKKLQKALGDVIGLYPPDHKTVYMNYSRDAQSVAMAVAVAAKAKDAKKATMQFRKLVPYCGKCHEDCAFALAPAFPQYSDE